jgi:hypothetical protein
MGLGLSGAPPPLRHIDLNDAPCPPFTSHGASIMLHYWHVAPPLLSRDAVWDGHDSQSGMSTIVNLEIVNLGVPTRVGSAEKQFAQLWRVVDADGSGAIDYAEFAGAQCHHA